MRHLFLFSLTMALIGSAGLGCSRGQQAASGVADEEASVSGLSLPELRQMLEDSDDDRVMVIAHRACWRLGPENSLQAIDGCVGLGVDMVEIDVRRSKDGHLMLMHDDTVDRTTNGSGPIEEMTLEEIGELRLREGAGGEEAALTEKRVPTLEQALLASKGKILVNLDMKADLYGPSLDLLEETGTTEQVLIKMNALPDESRLRSAKFLGKTFFMPIIRECRERPDETCSESLSHVVPQFAPYEPVAYEIVFQSESYLSEGVESIVNEKARVWVNTLESDHAAGHVDEQNVE
jgi:glycerophosphoryl diester phosphodiesterase